MRGESAAWKQLYWAVVLRQSADAELAITSVEELDATDELGRTVLMVLLQQRASRRSYRELVAILPMTSWAHKDSLGRTSLHYFAAKAKGIANARAVCKALDLELGGKHTCILEGDRDGNNALHYAARQNVATFNRLSRFQETAATVVTRFLVEKFPGALQSVNNNGHCPLRVLALAGHRDPLVAAIQSATAEDLLFKDGCGTSFLASVRLNNFVVERALASIPLPVLRQFEPEELSAGEPLLLASVTNSDAAICLLEALGDRLPRLLNDACIRTFCYEAAALGKFRILLFLLDNGFANWGYRCPARLSTIVGWIFQYTWKSHEEIVAARELFARLPSETFTTTHINNGTVNMLMVNQDVPLELVELVIDRTPEVMFTGRQMTVMVTSANSRFFSMLWRTLPDKCFTEPYALMGLVSRYYTTAAMVEELLEKCSDEALAPLPGEDSVLHLAVVNPVAPVPLTETVFPRAPALRDYKNAEGITALEAAHKRHAYYPHGVAIFERLVAIIAGHSSVKSAVI